MPLTDETRAAAREIIARYPKPRSALLPMLHLVQSHEGYVSPAGIALCAEELELTTAEVGAVATFYTMYKRRPAGDWLVSVCTNLSCQILGAKDIYACLSRHLGVGHDETTPDGMITLEHAECLAACDYAPVVTVNYEFFDNATPETALELVKALQRGERPEPTRGEPLITFRQVERELAGFPAGATVRAAVDAAGPAHPRPPAPVDTRGTVSTGGTEMAPTPAGFGVPAGVTERVVSPATAAATYGAEASADAAPTPTEDRPADATPNPTEDRPADATPNPTEDRPADPDGAV